MDSTQARATAVDIAARIVDRKLNFLDGVRKLTTLRFSLDAPTLEEAMTLLSSITSEMDEFPGSSQRHLWSENAIAEADARILKLEQFYRTDIDEICGKIIEQLGKSKE